MKTVHRIGSLDMGRLLAGIAMVMSSTAAFAGGAPQPSEADLLVAMHFVVPPFVAGAKVRTPEAIDTALAEELAAHLGRRLQSIPLSETGPATEAPVHADVALARLRPGERPPPATVSVPIGQAVGPMAIMRTDTDIKSWEQLSGRTVCVSQGGVYTGNLAQRYGAIEKVYRAPADALLALRTGGCDAAVHDDFLLEELLKLPEWKKFSAKLAPQYKEELAFLVPTGDARTVGVLQELTHQWKSAKHLKTLNTQRARDIAFEVYLDQVVADCH